MLWEFVAVLDPADPFFLNGRNHFAIVQEDRRSIVRANILELALSKDVFHLEGAIESAHDAQNEHVPSIRRVVRASP
jgi:hypothetical protein